MKIIIAGAGRIGALIARSLDREGHDITLIDRDAKTIERCSGELDVICVLGSATNPDTLRESGAEDADVLLALTESDEMNMLCALAAKRLGTRTIIARIRDPEYLSQRQFLSEAVGLSVIVNPASPAPCAWTPSPRAAPRSSNTGCRRAVPCAD